MRADTKTIDQGVLMPELSKRLGDYEASLIAELFAQALDLIEQGKDIVNLTTGEPDFATPDSACNAAIEAIHRGDTKYTNIDGTPSLKDAVRRKFKRDNNIDYSRLEIIAHSGAKPVIYQGLQAMIDPGDEVVVPTPCFASYPGMVAMLGGSPVYVACEESAGFKLSGKQLASAITPRTKVVILNSPNNPSGATYSRQELRALTDVLLDHPQVWILADDIYEHLTFDDAEFATVVEVEPRLKNRTLTVNGVSKAYAMTGWRIGYAGGPERLMNAIRKIISQTISNPSSIAQAAAVGALDGPQDSLAERCDIYQQRRDVVVERINAVPGLSCNKPEGAFYAFVNCADLIGRRTADGDLIETDLDLAGYFLNHSGVAVVPGSAFLASPYFRISLASPIDTVVEGCRRIGQAVSMLEVPLK